MGSSEEPSEKRRRLAMEEQMAVYLRSEQERQLFSKLAPWLVIPFEEEDGDDYWSSGVCFLWNPITLQTFRLPNIEDFVDDICAEDDDNCIYDCVLSSPPDDSDSMVYFLVLGLVNMIVFCRPGDRKWRVAVIPNTIANSDDLSTLIFFKGNLYVLCFVDHRQLLVEKRQVGRGRDDIILKITPLEVTLDCSQFPYIGGYSCSGERYFLESDEELFMIDLMCLNKRGYNHRAVSVHVARLDFSEMSWKEVSSLGDTVLFLGENSNACCSASELGLSKGCLFYTYPQDQYLYKFDVEDKCITTILPCLELPTPFFALNWIMMPIPIADGVGSMENVSGEVRQEDYLIKAKQTDEIMSEGESGNHGKKQTGEELEKAIPWVVVNEDIVDSIASHLHPVDFLHFRSVCKVSKVPIRKQTSGAIRTTYLTPWLLFSTEKHTVYNFVDPMHNNEKYLMELPELLVGAIIRSQKGGWLLMSKGNFNLFFYNPFTEEIIQLPELSHNYWFAGIAFSSLPTSSDCVVFGITQQNKERITICFVERGTDRWIGQYFQSSEKKFLPAFNSPIFHKGAFHCADDKGTLGVFNSNNITWKVLERPRGLSNAKYISFLVECQEELLLVRVLGMSITIFRLDSSKMAWRKVKNLGKHMLFINFTSCLSAIAPKSWMENKIFLPRLHDEQIVFFSLDTGIYGAVGGMQYAKDYFDTKCWKNCIWLEPNWSRSTSQELTWLGSNLP